MRSKSSTATTEDRLPSIIKNKLERYKIEGRLLNRKDLKLDNYVSVKANERIGNKKMKVILEILTFTNLEPKPVIPIHGKIISDVFKITLFDLKGTTITKDGSISFGIIAGELNPYCYPLLYNNGIWRIAEKFSIKSDQVVISDGDWENVVLIKEPPNEIISVSPNGGLVYSELDKVLNLRIPKGIFHENTNCKLQYVTLSEENLEDFRLVYEDELAPFVQLSSIFILQLVDQNRNLLNHQETFRRPITVKIPLPDWVISSLNDRNFDTKKIVQNQTKEKLGFYFLEKIGETWCFFDNHLKFTQNSLCFDTKHFGKFIFVNCRENRELKLCRHMNLVENLYSSNRGVILVFLYMKNQSWFLWMEAVEVSKIKATRESLENSGLVFIEQSYEYSIEKGAYNGRRMSRRLSKKEAMQRKTIDLFENIQFELFIEGNITQCDDKSIKKTENVSKPSQIIEKENHEIITNFNNLDQIGKRKVSIIDPKEVIEKEINPSLSYHSCSYHSNAVIIPIKPIEKHVKEWTDLILDNLDKRKIYKSSGHTEKEVIKVPINEIVQTDIDMSLIQLVTEDKFNISKVSEVEKTFSFKCEITLQIINCPTELMKFPSQKFQFYIPVDLMKEYFNILSKEELEELELERIRLEKEVMDIEKQTEQRIPVVNESNKPRTVNYTRIDKLSSPRVRNQHIVKDTKVISTKSLLAISSVIRQGLTLAIYLSLPENVIAGIGFDSLSQISSNGVNNTTYKVLITWKKMIHINKMTEEMYMEQLVDAVKMVGYENISMLIYDYWQQKKEITVYDCQRSLLMKNE